MAAIPATYSSHPVCWQAARHNSLATRGVKPINPTSNRELNLGASRWHSESAIAKKTSSLQRQRATLGMKGESSNEFAAGDSFLENIPFAVRQTSMVIATGTPRSRHGRALNTGTSSSGDAFLTVQREERHIEDLEIKKQAPWRMKATRFLCVQRLSEPGVCLRCLCCLGS